MYAFLFDDMLLLTRFRKLPQKVNKVRIWKNFFASWENELNIDSIYYPLLVERVKGIFCAQWSSSKRKYFWLSFIIILWIKHPSLVQKLNLTGMTDSPPSTPPVVRRSMSGAQYTVYKQVFILTLPFVVLFCWCYMPFPTLSGRFDLRAVLTLFFIRVLSYLSSALP